VTLAPVLRCCGAASQFGGHLLFVTGLDSLQAHSPSVGRRCRSPSVSGRWGQIPHARGMASSGVTLQSRRLSLRSSGVRVTSGRRQDVVEGAVRVRAGQCLGGVGAGRRGAGCTGRTARSERRGGPHPSVSASGAARRSRRARGAPPTRLHPAARPSPRGSKVPSGGGLRLWCPLWGSPSVAVRREDTETAGRTPTPTPRT